VRHLTRAEIGHLHALELQRSGGSPGIRDGGVLDSAVSQPTMTFDGRDLYPDTVSKAIALGFS
jgi:death-on-curing protein